MTELYNLRASSLPKTVNYDGTIKGVSVITAGPALGHGCSIDSTTLSQVVSCGARGVPVKMDHSQGLDRIVGSCRSFSLDGNQVRADVHLLKTHGAFSFIKELVEKQADTFGLSVSFAGSRETKDKTEFVRCSQLYSVDFVDLPAANPAGLFGYGRTPTAPDMVKLATAVFPSEMAALRRTVDPGQLAHRASRLFYLSNLSGLFPSMNVEEHRLEVGDPKPPFGLARAYRENRKAETLAALAKL